MYETDTPNHIHSGYNYPPVTPKRNWKRSIAALIAGVLVGTAVVLGIISLTNGDDDSGRPVQQPTSTQAAAKPAVEKPDTGVEACKTMANSINQNHALGANAPQTDADLAAAVKPFTSSKFTDLQNAGTNALSAILDVNKKVADDNASFTETMAAYAVASAKWGLLQDACKVHGVAVPPLPDNSKS